MKTVNYILVDDTARKNDRCDITYRAVPHLGYCCYVGSPDIKNLVKLRKQWPEAPLLGVSEVDTSASYAPIRVNPEMNALRRKMSDLP